MALLAGAPPAAALPDCSAPPQARVVAEGQGRLESIVSDGLGRLFYTDLTDNRLLRLDAPGEEPIVLAEGIARPGGLAFDDDGSLLVGFNGGALSGVPMNGMAGLYRVDPETGAKQTFVAGLDQANGLVRGPDGAFYTSNNIGGEVARVLSDGSVDARWAQLESPNGLTIDSTGTQLFAAETFRPAKITRVDLAEPGRQSTHFGAAPGLDLFAGLDGLTRDGADRLYAAANGVGEVWRVDTDGRACTLARGLGFPSALAFGGGAPGFDAHNLYVVTFTGRVVELQGAAEEPPAPGEATARNRRGPR